MYLHYNVFGMFFKDIKGDVFNDFIKKYKIRKIKLEMYIFTLSYPAAVVI